MSTLPPDTVTHLDRVGAALGPALLNWFAECARDLPWRRERTPYHTWISEVMLQQTQVETVRDYYRRFLARFPDVQTLATAPLDDVLKAWEGLGYYSRARLLHRAAREIVDRHGGQLPSDYESLRRLPGLGAYTAGAVASLAFGRPVPAVDGNVRRVFARVLALSNPTPAQLQAAVLKVQPPQAPGPFNEALMELGATVCRPQAPRCEICPWAAGCLARIQGRQEEFPAPSPRRELPHFDVAAAVTLDSEGRILVARRPQHAMLGGMWEFPGGKREAGETLEAALQRELREEMDIEIAVGEQITIVRHTYTHLRITLHAFWCRLIHGEPRCIECDGWQWATLEEIHALPMAITDRKIARAVEAQLSSR